MPIDYSKYHPEWKTRIRPDILKRAENKCEGSPLYPDCRAENKQPHPITGSNVVLCLGHLDHDIQNNHYDNLRAWCQRCHLAHYKNHLKEIENEFDLLQIPSEDKFKILTDIARFFLDYKETVRLMEGHPELWTSITSCFAENTIIQEVDLTEFENTTLT